MHISIIITAYNAEKFILSALQSIQKQTYSLYEVIIVDDGSCDKTVALINQFINDHHLTQFKLFSLSRVGRARVLDFGVKAAQYDYIAILDTDDLWHERKLELQVKYMQHYQLSFLATRFRQFAKDSDVDLALTLPMDINSRYLKLVTFNTMLCHNIIPHISVIFLKKLAQYDISRVRQIDYELWLRLLQSKVRMRILEMDLAFHRVHNEQFFEARDRFRYVLGTILLQLRFCLTNRKFLPLPYIFSKIFYYLIFTRRVRQQLNILLGR